MTAPGSPILPIPVTGWWVQQQSALLRVQANLTANLAVGLGAPRTVTANRTANLTGTYRRSSITTTVTAGRTAELTWNPAGAHYADDFNRANSNTTLGANWTNRENVMGINTNAAYPSAVSDTCKASYNSVMLTDNHAVSVVVGTLQSGGFDDIHLFLGANTTGQCAYCWFDNAGTDFYIYTLTSWGSVSINRAAASGSPTYTTGDTLKFSRTGNVYTGYKNGSAVAGLTWTDSGNVVPRDSSHRIVAIGGFNAAGTVYRRINSFAADDL